MTTRIRRRLDLLETALAPKVRQLDWADLVIGITDTAYQREYQVQLDNGLAEWSASALAAFAAYDNSLAARSRIPASAPAIAPTTETLEPKPTIADEQAAAQKDAEDRRIALERTILEPYQISNRAAEIMVEAQSSARNAAIVAEVLGDWSMGTGKK